MKVGERIAQLRKSRGMTQEDLARSVFVTRQAVSRWEQGASEPSVDMRKLLAGVLQVPVIDLFDLPDEPACQCCGTPFSVPNMPFGTDADGAENQDYCKWCYENGKYSDMTLDYLIEYNAPYLAKSTGMSQEDCVSFLGALLPTLKRWSGQEE